MPLTNTEVQRKYYADPTNKWKVLHNRHRRALEKYIKNNLEGPKPSVRTIIRYDLRELAAKAKINLDVVITPNVISTGFQEGVAKQIEKRVKQKLSEYDQKIAEALETTTLQIKSAVHQKPRTKGPLTLNKQVPLILQITGTKKAATTREGYKNEMVRLVQNILGLGPDEPIGPVLDDYRATALKIEDARYKNDKTK